MSPVWSVIGSYRTCSVLIDLLTLGVSRDLRGLNRAGFAGGSDVHP